MFSTKPASIPEPTSPTDPAKRKQSIQSDPNSYWSESEPEESGKPVVEPSLLAFLSKGIEDIKIGLDKANVEWTAKVQNGPWSSAGGTETARTAESVKPIVAEVPTSSELATTKPALERTPTFPALPALPPLPQIPTWLSLDQLEAARKKFVVDTTAALLPPIVSKSLALLKDPNEFPELERSASVRRGTELCAEELAFRQARLKKTHAAIERFLGESIHPDDVPIIAIAGSGGGCRALTASAGALSKLSDLGLLDATTYLAGVSGTTWAIAASQASDWDFDTLRIKLGTVLSGNMMSFPIWLGKAWQDPVVVSPLVEKWTIPEDTLSAVDLWSSFIAGALFGGEVQGEEGDQWMGQWELRSLSRQTMDGSAPMPIFQVVRDVVLPGQGVSSEAAAVATTGSTTEALVIDPDSAAKVPVPAVVKWLPYEFTPFEMGTTLGGGHFIPTWSFGRRFLNGADQDKRAEISFATILGVCSSAFTANVTSVFENFEATLPARVKKQLESILAEKGSIHVVEPARFCNPFYVDSASGEQTTSTSDDISGAKDIPLMDAGMWDNLPFPALMHPGREIDVVIALEHTRDPGIEANLRFADAYAREHGHAWCELPEELDPKTWTSDVVTRFKGGPEMVYFPLIATPGFKHTAFDPATNADCSTFNFQVPWLSFEELWNCARRNVGSELGVEAVKSAVRDAVGRKRDARLGKEKRFGLF